MRRLVDTGRAVHGDRRRDGGTSYGTCTHPLGGGDPSRPHRPLAEPAADASHVHPGMLIAVDGEGI